MFAQFQKIKTFEDTFRSTASQIAERRGAALNTRWNIGAAAARRQSQGWQQACPFVGWRTHLKTNMFTQYVTSVKTQLILDWYGFK